MENLEVIVKDRHYKLIIFPFFFPRTLFSSLNAILPLPFSLCEGAVPAPSINATIKVSTLLVLDLTSDPTLPNVSAPHLSAPAVINKEPWSQILHIPGIQTVL